MDKIIIFRIGECEKYNGTERPIGGQYNENNTGFELSNFLNNKGFYYAYAPVVRNEKLLNLGLEKIGELDKNESIKGVTVVFVSYAPSKIIGFYKNATVYQYPQIESNNNKLKEENIPYYATAKVEDGYLFPSSERVKIEINIGQSNAYYPTEKEIKNINDIIFNSKHITLKNKKIISEVEKTEKDDTKKEIMVELRMGFPVGFKERIFKLAKYKCENQNCKTPNRVPFYKNGNDPYLEIHHFPHYSKIKKHKEEGCFALCPNCHREAHYGKEKMSFRERDNDVI